MIVARRHGENIRMISDAYVSMIQAMVTARPVKPMIVRIMKKRSTRSLATIPPLQQEARPQRLGQQVS
jgi:hypothetical protein